MSKREYQAFTALRHAAQAGVTQARESVDHARSYDARKRDWAARLAAKRLGLVP